MRYDGTRATLFGDFTTERGKIEIHDHLTNSKERVRIPASDGTGHGGGDFGVVASFVRAMRGEEGGLGSAEVLTSARASLESHLMAFAAEQARLEGTIVEMGTFRQQAETLTGE